MNSPIEPSPNRPIAVVGDIHDWNEDRPHGITRDQYWEMFLEGLVGPRERVEARQFLDGPDLQTAERRRIDAERRLINRRANKAARAARRAGRR